MYRAQFPDLVMSLNAQYEDGDVVISRWTATGTHTGDLPMLPASGRTATVTGILIDRFEGDQIAETWSGWDALGMLQQLGAIPAAEAGARRVCVAPFRDATRNARPLPTPGPSPTPGRAHASPLASVCRDQRRRQHDLAGVAPLQLDPVVDVLSDPCRSRTRRLVGLCR
jgi:hypothetical protein